MLPIKNKAHCAEHSRRGVSRFTTPTDGQSLT
nr:MAG TPA: hypothetical protein [Caudoviricetes sp.]